MKQGETPDGVVDLIKDIILDKIVCDVGCGDGKFMSELSKYAKEVVGIEEQPELAKLASDKGFNIYVRNTFFEPLPQADVYYLWTKDAMGVYLKAQHEGTTGVFIFGETHRRSTLKFIESLNPEIRSINNFKIYIK